MHIALNLINIVETIDIGVVSSCLIHSREIQYNEQDYSFRDNKNLGKWYKYNVLTHILFSCK